MSFCTGFSCQFIFNIARSYRKLCATSPFSYKVHTKYILHIETLLNEGKNNFFLLLNIQFWCLLTWITKLISNPDISIVFFNKHNFICFNWYRGHSAKSLCAFIYLFVCMVFFDLAWWAQCWKLVLRTLHREERGETVF